MVSSKEYYTYGLEDPKQPSTNLRQSARRPNLVGRFANKLNRVLGKLAEQFAALPVVIIFICNEKNNTVMMV